MKTEPIQPSLDDDPVNSRILGLVTDLGNTVLTKRAAGDLYMWVQYISPKVRLYLRCYRIKSKTPKKFSSVSLFRKVMFILESHDFRLPVRRFIINLFNKSVMRQIVLDDESEGE